MEEGVDCVGHEGAGVVAAVGPGVTGWKVGDKAGITPVAKTWCVSTPSLSHCKRLPAARSAASASPVVSTTAGYMHSSPLTLPDETLCEKRQYVAKEINGTYTQYP